MLIEQFLNLFRCCSVGALEEVAIYGGCGAGERVAGSACYRYQRYACCYLHGDVGVSQRVHRSVWQSHRVTHLMYPCVHSAGGFQYTKTDRIHQVTFQFAPFYSVSLDEYGIYRIGGKSPAGVL